MYSNLHGVSPRRLILDGRFFEMPTSSFVESGFWCFDALFVPQQHPAREVQDTFYLSGISHPTCAPS